MKSTKKSHKKTVVPKEAAKRFPTKAVIAKLQPAAPSVMPQGRPDTPLAATPEPQMMM